ncbi:MAG: DUF3560 domain-containing protein [Porticoccaceae bacterium]|nr:DUF3560 domain-containing protein [Porticoccaceae bacterium]
MTTYQMQHKTLSLPSPECHQGGALVTDSKPLLDSGAGLGLSHKQNKSKQKDTITEEAPAKHGGGRRKTTKQNPATLAARKTLIAMSQEAKDMMEMATDGMQLDGFESCEKINDFLVVMHQKATGCDQFRTFHDWKKAGYKVKKGSKSYRVWGSPLKAKIQREEQQSKAAPESDGKSDTGKSFKFWPMCSLFTENQVERIKGGEDNPEPTEPTEPKPTKSIETRQAEAVGNSAIQDMGNNESLARGLFPQPSGDFMAMSFTESKPFKTRAGAVRWLASRGLDATGRSIEQPKAEEGSAINMPSPFVTVDYKEQQEARKDRMLERADKASEESQATYNRAKDMASVIPFGQPILVGHHSEQRDRNYRNKIHNTFGKAFDLDGKADHYRQKAATVGNAGIASNDPEAIEKLKDKLTGLQRSQEIMKTVNKIIRAAKLTDAEKTAEIVAAGLLSEAQAIEILKPDYCGGVGFASYSLSNNNAEINRTKKRIAGLDHLRRSAPLKFGNDDFSLAVENGRVCITFSDGKPCDDVRTMLRASAFKWSRYQVAWVRKATVNGVSEARRLLNRLQAVEEIY